MTNVALHSCSPPCGVTVKHTAPVLMSQSRERAFIAVAVQSCRSFKEVERRASVHLEFAVYLPWVCPCLPGGNSSPLGAIPPPATLALSC